MKSIKGMANMVCPKCNEEFESEFWSLVNTATTPELKESVIGGELNLVSCPHCEHFFYHQANMIYFDAATSLLVFVFDEASKAQEKELKEKMHHDFNLIKNNLAKDMKIPGEPLYVFGLQQLKELLEEDEMFAQESEVVAAASAATGLKLSTLEPSFARKHGYPLYAPVKSGNDAADLAASAQKVLDQGVKSPRLKKLAQDMQKGNIKPQFL